MFMQVGEHRCHENVDSAQQVALRDHVVEPEFIKKARLLSILSSHHRRIFPLSFNEQESSFSPLGKPFFDSIDPMRTVWRWPHVSQVALQRAISSCLDRPSLPSISGG